MLTREQLVEAARPKRAAPYTLDEELTFFCPVENEEGLDHPKVRAYREWLAGYRPPDDGRPAILLIIPCQKAKPYSLSPEHRAINGALIDAGFPPAGRGDWPEELARLSTPDLLSNAPLVGHGVRIDRVVVSEPLALVPYEAMYRWQGEPSLAARYDDPGLFAGRGLGCPWRDDCQARPDPRGRYRWGDAERAAYVRVQDRLVETMVATLQAWSPHYSAMIAFVGATLSHRSFLSSLEDRRASGLRTSFRCGGRRLPLRGVNDIAPGLLRVLPSTRQIADMRAHDGTVRLSGARGAAILVEEVRAAAAEAVARG